MDEGVVPCPDSGDSIGNGIDYCVWTWVAVVFCPLLRVHTREQQARLRAGRPTQAKQTYGLNYGDGVFAGLPC